MNDRSTTFGTEGNNLAKLFSVGSEIQKEPIKSDKEEQKSELLWDYLRMPFGLWYKSERSGSNSNINSEDDCDEFLVNILLNPEAEIPLIKKIKDRAKELSTSAQNNNELEAANSIYYAAISNALVFHKLKITSYSYKDLANFLSRLQKETWIPANILMLQRLAEDMCKRHF